MTQRKPVRQKNFDFHHPLLGSEIPDVHRHQRPGRHEGSACARKHLGHAKLFF